MLLLLGMPSLKGFAPAMRIDTLIGYMRWRKQPKGTLLIASEESGKPVHRVVGSVEVDGEDVDVYGEQMHCLGVVKCNKKLNQFTSAVSGLHRHSGHTGDYEVRKLSSVLAVMSRH
jgi:hypothetical protein